MMCPLENAKRFPEILPKVRFSFINQYKIKKPDGGQDYHSSLKLRSVIREANNNLLKYKLKTKFRNKDHFSTLKPPLSTSKPPLLPAMRMNSRFCRSKVSLTPNTDYVGDLVPHSQVRLSRILKHNQGSIQILPKLSSVHQSQNTPRSILKTSQMLKFTPQAQMKSL